MHTSTIVNRWKNNKELGPMVPVLKRKEFRMTKKQRIFIYLLVWAGLVITAEIFLFKAHIMANSFEVTFLLFYMGLIVCITGTMIELLILLYRKRLSVFIEKRNHKKAWMNFFALVACLFSIVAYVFATMIVRFIEPILIGEGLL